MRHGLVLTGVLIAALGLASGASAAPVPGTAWSKAASIVQPVGYWDRQYRHYGPYAAPPVVVVPQPAPVVPPVVV
jgi:type IV secretory pathway protease TraF